MERPKQFARIVSQRIPIYLDKAASLTKAIRLLGEARKRDAELVAFGETWLPGYPAWHDVSPNVALWDHVATAVPGPEILALQILSPTHGALVLVPTF